MFRFPTEKWQLHDLSNDPGETNDLSSTLEAKARLSSLLQAWTQYVEQTGTIVLNDPAKEFQQMVIPALDWRGELREGEKVHRLPGLEGRSFLCFVQRF